MSNLPLSLVARITQRIQDPSRRHDFQSGAAVAVVSDPGELAGMFEAVTPGSGQAFQLVIDQMKAWGKELPAMHVTRNDDGTLAASSEDKHALPLAGPASAAAVARIEALIDRPLPGDLLQLYAIADGGWGPGTAYTSGHGTGFYSLDGIASTLEDLRRRGPGYTGEMAWPANLLPIADTTGPVSYDLDAGTIVAFNDYWYDDDLAIEKAFTTIYPSLAAWLETWVIGDDRSMST